MGDSFRAKQRMGKKYSEVRKVLEKGLPKVEAWRKAKELGVSYRKAEMYKDFDEMRVRIARENLFWNAVVAPMAEKWSTDLDGAIKRIDKLRQQQYFTEDDLRDYQEFLNLYRMAFPEG